MCEGSACPIKGWSEMCKDGPVNRARVNAIHRKLHLFNQCYMFKYIRNKVLRNPIVLFSFIDVRMRYGLKKMSDPLLRSI